MVKKEEHLKIAFKPETFQTNANNCECHFLNAKDPFLICEHDFVVEKESDKQNIKTFDFSRQNVFVKNSSFVWDRSRSEGRSDKLWQISKWLQRQNEIFICFHNGYAIKNWNFLTLFCQIEKNPSNIQTFFSGNLTQVAS